MELRGLPVNEVDEVAPLRRQPPRLLPPRRALHPHRPAPLLGLARRSWLALSQGFLRDATTAEQANALRALALCHVVDSFLSELSFVDDTPRGLVLRGVVHRDVFAELHVARPDLAKAYVERGIDALAAADTTRGDGFFMGLDVETGAYKLASFYYTGKGIGVIAQHLVKRFVFY